MSKFSNFLTGALIGAGIGILLAPKEGSKTRSDLKKSFDELCTTVKEINWEEAKQNTADKIDNFKSEWQELDKDEAIASVEEKESIIETTLDEIVDVAANEKVKTSVNKVKEVTHQIANDVKEDVAANKKEVKKEETKKSPAKKKKTTAKKKTTKKKTTTKKK